MMHEWEMRGFESGNAYGMSSVDGFIKYVNETQSFKHLTNDIIRGWIKGRFEKVIFGRQVRSRSYYVNVKCNKCKGRGWFGRGRKDCPECVSVGKEPVWSERRWRGGRKFTGNDKRKLIWSEYNLGLLDISKLDYAIAFDRAADHSEGYYPAWIDDIKADEKHLRLIKDRFTFYKNEPKVKDAVSSRHDASACRINSYETIARLAMTFGCTCPITGEYIPPDQVSTIEDSPNRWDRYDYKYEVGYDLYSLVKPFGFSEQVHIRRFQPNGRGVYFNCVSPFSERGIKIICNAATKCLKALDGKIDNEWVLAEVMQSAILKRAA
jgi:hypothetical protein